MNRWHGRLTDILGIALRISTRGATVLGDLVFVYIHPYMDGNGRIGRFLMNTMMASGGYPWTVIPVNERGTYVNALESASVGEDIAPFATFLGGLVQRQLAGEPLPAVPNFPT
jgi:hypothetical protein